MAKSVHNLRNKIVWVGRVGMMARPYSRREITRVGSE